MSLASLVLLAGCSGGDATPEPVSGSGTPPVLSDAWLHTTYHYVGELSNWSIGLYRIGQSYVCDDDIPFTVEAPEGGTCVNSLTRDGLPGNYLANLKNGQIVEVYKPQYPDAPSIDIRRTAVGPVESIDAPHAQFVLLGQRVHVRDQTQGDAADLSSLTAGDWIEVSGYFTVDGQIVATRMDHDTEAGSLVLRGVLTMTASNQFAIGNLQLDLSAAIPEGFPGGLPAAGDAALLLADQAPQNGVLVVQTARYAGGVWEESLPADYSAVTELTGFVTASRSTTDFDVAGYTFRPHSCDDCERLSTPVPENVLVAASTERTKFAAAGTEKNKSYLKPLENPSCCFNPTLIGPIESIDPVSGALSVFGIAVQTSPATRIFEGDTSRLDSPLLGVADLAIGDTVTVTGGVAGWQDKRLFAGTIARHGTGIQIRTDEDNGSLSVSASAVTFLNRSILTDAATPVTFCYFSQCDARDQAWLTNHTFGYDIYTVDWTIDIDPAAVPFRAIAVSVHAY